MHHKCVIVNSMQARNLLKSVGRPLLTVANFPLSCSFLLPLVLVPAADVAVCGAVLKVYVCVLTVLLLCCGVVTIFNLQRHGRLRRQYLSADFSVERTLAVSPVN